MILIVLCGYPASGKTSVALSLATSLEARGVNVQIASDGAVATTDVRSHAQLSDGCHQRSEMYADSAAEKNTRARLLAAVERSLSRNTAVIVDSMNYIKGFRYELFCVAKTCGVKYMVVHVVCDESTCTARDRTREDGYGEACTASLFQRFEAPIARNRWDSPLHEIKMDNFDADNEDCPANVAIREAADAAVLTTTKLKTTMATQERHPVQADALNALDKATREAEAALISAVMNGAGAGDAVAIPNSAKKVILVRPFNIHELRGMRRAHLNLAKLCPPEDTSASSLVESYVRYVNAQLRAGS